MLLLTLSSKKINKKQNKKKNKNEKENENNSSPLSSILTISTLFSTVKILLSNLVFYNGVFLILLSTSFSILL